MTFANSLIPNDSCFPDTCCCPVRLANTAAPHIALQPGILHSSTVSFRCCSAGHRFSKEVVIQNQGKHTVTLVWTNTTFAAVKSKQAKAQKKGPVGKKVLLHSDAKSATLKAVSYI